MCQLRDKIGRGSHQGSYWRAMNEFPTPLMWTTVTLVENLSKKVRRRPDNRTLALS